MGVPPGTTEVYPFHATMEDMRSGVAWFDHSTFWRATMSRNWMVEEGDRAGVNTPSKRDKAKNRVEAAVQRLQFVLAQWEGINAQEFSTGVSEAETSLNAARQLMLDEAGA
jgi:hypothetical protein